MSTSEYSALIDELVEQINKAINIPFLSERQEAIAIRCILEILLTLVDRIRRVDQEKK